MGEYDTLRRLALNKVALSAGQIKRAVAGFRTLQQIMTTLNHCQIQPSSNSTTPNFPRSLIKWLNFNKTIYFRGLELNNMLNYVTINITLNPY